MSPFLSSEESQQLRHALKNLRLTDTTEAALRQLSDAIADRNHTAFQSALAELDFGDGPMMGTPEDPPISAKSNEEEHRSRLLVDNFLDVIYTQLDGNFLLPQRSAPPQRPGEQLTAT